MRAGGLRRFRWRTNGSNAMPLGANLFCGRRQRLAAKRMLTRERKASEYCWPTRVSCVSLHWPPARLLLRRRRTHTRTKKRRLTSVAAAAAADVSHQLAACECQLAAALRYSQRCTHSRATMTRNDARCRLRRARALAYRCGWSVLGQVSVCAHTSQRRRRQRQFAMHRWLTAAASRKCAGDTRLYNCPMRFGVAPLDGDELTRSGNSSSSSKLTSLCCRGSSFSLSTFALVSRTLCVCVCVL